MIKIIDNKKYDTNTAKMLFKSRQGRDGDVNYVSKTLYLKKTGEFFLYAEGKIFTDYGERCDSVWSNGAAIFPLTVDEAKEWVSYNCSGEDYIELFGDVEE